MENLNQTERQPLRAGLESRTALMGIICAALVLGLDQLTKILVLRNIVSGEIISIIPNFFNLTLTYNYGIAFGMLSNFDPNLRTILLVVVTSVALLVVAYLFVVAFRHDKYARIALALIVGGALGNITDRVLYGAVVDFLDFYIKGFHWPAFNVADSAICIGVVFLLFRNPESAVAAVKQES